MQFAVKKKKKNQKRIRYCKNVYVANPATNKKDISKS